MKRIVDVRKAWRECLVALLAAFETEAACGELEGLVTRIDFRGRGARTGVFVMQSTPWYSISTMFPSWATKCFLTERDYKRHVIERLVADRVRLLTLAAG
jgi:hypothetical protein